MSEPNEGMNPGFVWRDQPDENPIDFAQVVCRRTEEMSASTRSEILMSIASALLLAGVVGWRLEIAREGLLKFGVAAAIAWAVISLYAFRRRIWPRESRRDAIAATGLDYYRKELERRRDHLRSGWLWHGPLFLASIILIAVFTGRANIAFQPLRSVLPLLVLLGAWTGFGIWRRLRQARNLQREIEEIASLEGGSPTDTRRT